MIEQAPSLDPLVEGVCIEVFSTRGLAIHECCEQLPLLLAHLAVEHLPHHVHGLATVFIVFIHHVLHEPGDLAVDFDVGSEDGIEPLERSLYGQKFFDASCDPK